MNARLVTWCRTLGMGLLLAVTSASAQEREQEGGPEAIPPSGTQAGAVAPASHPGWLGLGLLPQQTYAGGSLAQVLVAQSGWDDGQALVARGGVALDRWQEGLAAETELTRTVGAPSSSYSGGSVDAGITSLAASARYDYPVWREVAVHGRLGLRLTHIGYSADDAEVEPDTDTTFGLTGGLGVSYPVVEALTVNAAYDWIKEDISHVSIGADYHF